MSGRLIGRPGDLPRGGERSRGNAGDAVSAKGWLPEYPGVAEFGIAARLRTTFGAVRKTLLRAEGIHRGRQPCRERPSGDSV